jgi:hypothetical protein
MAKIIKANGEVIENVQPKKGKHFELKELQEIVGGYIENVWLVGGNDIMVINEEGKLNDLPYNELATKTANLRNDYIVGDVIIINRNQIK